MEKNHRGTPSGVNKQAGLGLRSDMLPEKINQEIKMTNKYTTDEDNLAEHVRLRHHNRNTTKSKAMNAGRYKQYVSPFYK